MFLEQGIKVENNFGKYIIGSLLIIAISFIGQLPLLAAILYQIFVNGRKYQTNNFELMHFFEPNFTLFLILIPSVITLFGIYFIIRYLHGQTLLSVTTARESIDWSRVSFSFALWTLITIASVLVTFYINPENFKVNFNLVPFLVLVLIGTLLIPFQTTVEEYVFRGYLMQGFANLARNRWFPLVMTSVIFGLMHLANPEVEKMGSIILVYYIGTGLFLGIITLMDEGMELALGFHAANNLVSALLVTSDWSAFQTHSIFKDVSEPKVGFDIILPVVVIYPFLLFIFSRKYKWSDWKKKLI